MNVCGIIAEYNPFHQGHIHHIKKTREITQCDALVVITSSYFSQRGLPSLLTLEDKTKLALKNSVDLVIELPACFSCQSADYFAKYAIDSLSQLHIDSLSFGSESLDIELLKKQNNLNPDPTRSLNQSNVQTLQPNDILAAQYIKYCKINNIDPILIQRNASFESATSIRHHFFNSSKKPYSELFQEKQSWDSYYPYLKTFLSLSDPIDIEKYHLVTEGIEYRLIQNAKQCDTWEQFLEKSISKTYTRARIQRTCMMILLQIKKEDMPNTFNQVIVSGFNEVGRQILKENKNASIATKFSELDPYLQNIENKTLALYSSVNLKKVKRNKVICI